MFILSSTVCDYLYNTKETYTASYNKLAEAICNAVAYFQKYGAVDLMCSLTGEVLFSIASDGDTYVSDAIAFVIN